MNHHEVNGKAERIQDFSSLGKIENQIFLHFFPFWPVNCSSFIDKSAQELINAAIEARDFSYR